MDGVRRILAVLGAVLVAATTAIAIAPPGLAVTPWFADGVGGATQVISVVGVGGSQAKMDVYERAAAGWQPVAAGIDAWIGDAGIAAQTTDGSMKTPMGAFTLDFAFGTDPNPGGGLQYVQVGPNHWWDGDMESPTYNTMQVCEEDQCPFNTALSSGTENLEIPQYKHAVVMGVNKERIPGRGGAFFVHSTDGGPTAGCIAIDDATLVQIMQWLRPGAVIAVSQ